MNSRRLIWVGHSAHMGERNACKGLDRKPGRKRLLGRPMCSWEDTVKTDLK
jgi:hypothetical protein